MAHAHCLGLGMYYVSGVIVLFQANTFVPARRLFCTNLAVNKSTLYVITFVHSLIKHSQITLMPKHTSSVAAHLPVQYWGTM